jgi:hypothetical protein
MIQAAYFSFLECLLYLAYPLEVAKRRPCALVGKSSSTAICRLGALSYAQLKICKLLMERKSPGLNSRCPVGLSMENVLL